MSEENASLHLCNLVSRGMSLKDARQFLAKEEAAAKAALIKAEKVVVGAIHAAAQKVADATAPKPAAPAVPPADSIL